MKIHQWIDKYNYLNSYDLISKYYRAIDSGKSAYFYLNISLWGNYLIRLLLVLTALITFKKNTYRTFNKLWSQNFKNFVSTLFGFKYHAHPILVKSPEEVLKTRLTFARPKDPLVSIVIPAGHDLSCIYHCLSTIAIEVSDALSYEVIVVDDSGSELISDFFSQQTSGINYIKSEGKKGYVHLCNAGAKMSNGKLVCFLRPDVQVKTDWLEALVKTFQDEKVGGAGSKMMYQNGLLQEAGAFVYSDASTVSYGNFRNPDHPEYNYIREVDYCEGISFMLGKDDLIRIGYLNINLDPSHAIIDSCFTIRHELGKKILFQPLSQVIVSEDKWPQPEHSTIKFREKWAAALQAYPPPHQINLALEKYRPERTILVIDDTTPTPDQDSGSLRLFQLMKIMRSMGYHLIFLANDGKKKGRYTNDLIAIGAEIIYKFPNRKGMLEILAEKIRSVDVAWICKFQNNIDFDFIFDINKKLKRVYDTIDLHYLRIQREADLIKDNRLLAHAQLVKEIEISNAKKADLTISITEDERLLLAQEGIEHVVSIPNIHSTKMNEDSASFRERSGLLFIGGYAHKPNIDCAKWLIEEIMPEVWEINPSIKITLLGSNPTKEILSLASDKVSVPGYILDVSPYFNHARVFVSPLRFGAGMKGKIGQSLEFGLPIVTTDIGAEGMNLIDGESVIIANETREFADKILEIYNNEQLWQKIRSNAKKSISAYSPEQVGIQLAGLFQRLYNQSIP